MDLNIRYNQAMAIKFDEPQAYNNNRFSPTAPKSKMAAMLIGWGIAKTPAQANLVLIVIVVLLFAFVIFSLMRSGDETEIDLDPTIDTETNLPYGVQPPR